MSDDDRDIDIESDDENDSDTRSQNRSSTNGTQFFSQAEKRAHHNALERKRRDHIKDSFTSLKESVPSLQGEKAASRAQILKKAADFIQFMRRKNFSHQQDIDDLKRQNKILEQQIKQLEQQQANLRNGDYHKDMKSDTSSDELTDGEEPIEQKSKKFKSTSSYAG
ncbi:protein max [Bradysia coprophila]|uniref:protein max n=1 Tax=Bradysia coprophila TaxID=38358 RepID=UPI00187D72F8|nr:protein max [Bradysia coprophila]XP_037025787.1 protein max [Bradysia coprophila]